MIDPDELLKRLQSKDPVTHQTAVQQVKEMGPTDRNVLLKATGGIEALHELLAGPYVPPDDGQVGSVSLSMRRTEVAVIGEPESATPPMTISTPDPARAVRQEQSLFDNDCSTHQGVPAYGVDREHAVCLACASEAYRKWRRGAGC